MARMWKLRFGSKDIRLIWFSEKQRKAFVVGVVGEPVHCITWCKITKYVEELLPRTPIFLSYLHLVPYPYAINSIY